jgi:hypothetical protein
MRWRWLTSMPRAAKQSAGFAPVSSPARAHAIGWETVEPNLVMGSDAGNIGAEPGWKGPKKCPAGVMREYLASGSGRTSSDRIVGRVWSTVVGRQKLMLAANNIWDCAATTLHESWS